MLELHEIKLKKEWGEYVPVRYEIKYKQMNTNMGKEINGSKWRIQI